MQVYARNHWLARLFRLGVEFMPYLRLYGVDSDTVFLQNILNNDRDNDCDNDRDT